uniref:POU-specific domain-containing protein n=1 Tax=Strix occidentalis caurina TaxID=311401 RepID=A0A8D0F9Q7_STROC
SSALHDLEELEKFAKTFKQRRIKLGFTQVSSLISGKGGATCDVDMLGWGSLWQRHGWRKGWIR